VRLSGAVDNEAGVPRHHIRAVLSVSLACAERKSLVARNVARLAEPIAMPPADGRCGFRREFRDVRVDEAPDVVRLRGRRPRQKG